jgi:hypothetical protein
MTLKPGDKVNYLDLRIAWTEAEVISTPEITVGIACGGNSGEVLSR